MADGTIDSLSIEIGASSAKAVNQIKKVAEAMKGLKDVMGEGAGETITKLGQLAEAMKRLKEASDIKINAGLPKRIREIGEAVDSISDDSIRRLDALTSALGRLKGVDLRGFSSAMKSAARSVQMSTALTTVNHGPLATRSAQASPSGGALVPVMQSVSDAEIADIFSRAPSAIPGGHSFQTKGAYEMLDGLRTKVIEFGKTWHRVMSEAGKAIDKKEPFKGINGIMRSFGRIAFYRLIRSAIKAVTDAISEGTTNAYNFSKALETSEAGTLRIAEAYDQLASASFKMSNQLGAAWASLVRAVLPIILQLISYVTTLANVLTQLFAAFTGRSTYLKAVDYNKEWAESAGGAAAAAKEWKNQILGFDEINRLEAPGTPGGGGGGAATPDYENMFEMAEIEERFKAISDKFATLKKLIKNHLDDIKKIVFGAELAIGVILLLTGVNIPLGLAMTVDGARRIWKTLKEDWNSTNDKVKKTLDDLALIVGGASLAVGAILAFTGINIPLGVGLMAAGISTIAVTIGVNWDDLPAKLRHVLAQIAIIIGGASIGVGAVLAFSGLAVPLGIGLMAAGLASVVGGMAVDWNYIKDNVGHALSDIFLIAGSAMLAIGLILTLACPGFSPLGLGLLVGGAVALAAAVGVNWDWITEQMKGTLGLITTIAGAALLAIGLILTCSGVAIPLGLGMMVAGGFALHTGIANYDWDALKKKLAGVWKGIKDWWNRDVAKFFTKAYWQSKLDEVFGRLQFPHISLPHLQVEWEPLSADNPIARLFNLSAIPNLSVSWYAKGGIIDGATLIGAGEAGREAIIPLERNREWIGSVARELQSMGGFDGADTADAVEQGSVEIVNAIFSVATQIITAINDNSGGDNINFDRFVQRVTQTQRKHARAAG